MKKKKNLSDSDATQDDVVIIITLPDEPRIRVYGTFKTKDQVTKALDKICKDWTVKEHHRNKIDVKILRKP